MARVDIGIGIRITCATARNLSYPSDSRSKHPDVSTGGQNTTIPGVRMRADRTRNGHPKQSAAMTWHAMRDRGG